MSRRQACGALLSAALGSGCASRPAADGGDTSLDALARAKGLRFGSVLGRATPERPGSFDDDSCRTLTARECSVLVLENESKWPQLRPDPREPYRFAPADEMFAWGRAQGMALRGHTLLWMPQRWLPAWIAQVDFGTQPAVRAQGLLAEHIHTTCAHFGHAIESWDVVNEAVDHLTGQMRENTLSKHLGDPVALVAEAFHLARAHAPHAQLVYNDFMSWDEGGEPHRRGVLTLLAELRRRGAPVHALGVQAHIGVWSLPASGDDAAARRAQIWRRFLDEVTSLGLDLLVTELDVEDRALPADLAARDAGVAAVARDWLDVTLANPRLHRLLCWGLTDRHSWLHTDNPRPDGLAKRPLPYDELGRPKPLRQAIAQALRAAPAR